jgi:hypothetical protein
MSVHLPRNRNAGTNLNSFIVDRIDPIQSQPQTKEQQDRSVAPGCRFGLMSFMVSQQQYYDIRGMAYLLEVGDPAGAVPEGPYPGGDQEAL